MTRVGATIAKVVAVFFVVCFEAMTRPGQISTAPSHEIQGIDSAKLEVMELVDTLQYPDAILGALPPAEVLLKDRPGTGITMLARATVASAVVPLLYCSGSDFVEMFVGRGAAGVQKFFERAAKESTCLIIIDELDALGKSREFMSGFGRGGGSNNFSFVPRRQNSVQACFAPALIIAGLLY